MRMRVFVGFSTTFKAINLIHANFISDTLHFYPVPGGVRYINKYFMNCFYLCSDSLEFLDQQIQI